MSQLPFCQEAQPRQTLMRPAPPRRQLKDDEIEMEPIVDLLLEVKQQSRVGGGYARLTLRMMPARVTDGTGTLAETLETALFKAFEELSYDVRAGLPPKSNHERKVRAMRGRR